MFIIVSSDGSKCTVNINQIRKYHDHQIKFVNDDIMTVKETKEEIDLMISAIYDKNIPMTLVNAQRIEKNR